MNDMQNEQAGRRGGPKTNKGKLAASRNSLKHGLTSKKLIPELLRKDQVAEIQASLDQEFKPAGTTEQLLVAEMARHAAMMELGEKAEGAVLRHGARELSGMILSTSGEPGDDADEREDAVLASAVSTEALDKFNRYRRGHEKAFYTALNKLREIQHDRMTRQLKEKTEQKGNSANLFETEAACEKHLAKRFSRSNWRCPRCHGAQGSWLRRQKRWECNGCHRQVGLRHGTVMERSQLALTAWFRAIQEVVHNPDITSLQLAEVLGIQRRGTVIRMINRITNAMQADGASTQLASLNTIAKAETT